MTGSPGACRSCGARPLEPVLSLGRMPLVNALVAPQQLETVDATFPLDVACCPTCALLQITHIVPPEQLFREYVYFSSHSDTMVQHAAALADRVMAERHLTAASLAMEVASNDGYLLQHYVARGVPVLGIEPARNIAVVAERERGVRTVAEFFNEDLAEQLSRAGQLADVLHAHNVLAHVPDINGFVRAVARVLAPDGVAVIEVPYALDLVEKCEFDTIYHEHVFYFTLTALSALFARHGLSIQRAERIAIHGGSLRIFVGHADAGAPDDSVAAVLSREREKGADAVGYYTDFAARVRRLREELRALVLDLGARGCTIAAYGAAAKGVILLNFVGLDHDIVRYVVDRSPQKQGRYLPGVRIPIQDPAWLTRFQPDYVLLLAWNLASEVLDQQAPYRQRGGKFIIPLPSPVIV
jgi:SAM-dependent methyltransferase